jgi:hypothetical protein
LIDSARRPQHTKRLSLNEKFFISETGANEVDRIAFSHRGATFCSANLIFHFKFDVLPFRQRFLPLNKSFSFK